VRVRLFDPSERERARKVLAAVLGVPVHPEHDPAALAARVTATDGARDVAQRVAGALDELARAGIAVSDFALGQPSLDEVFLALTGSRAEPEPEKAAAIA
jgi:ABC-2 type transport system ATP-binding protein